ncbi:cupredoxin domain-containing protein [Paludisphaera mucosa]|uniref:Cupredoxin domain-containing protein n=1 Tax=Paludisphaera mucosa TaxID=3030827 RepID=A0ABT6FCW3_9BACT|nr:cupredoxin domain-containing protein [Paludisphaera mucosa]MDG3005412.1 cupredoxin domain-containing protein [Paludisphaera mucosa]
MKNKWAFPVCYAVTIFAVLCPQAPGGDGSKRSDGKKVTVTMKSLSFSPKTLEIEAGDSVVWSNEARTKHTAISDDDGKSFDTGEIEPEKSSKPVKFDTEGEFKYHCKVHGKSMSGTVVVKAKSK